MKRERWLSTLVALSLLLALSSLGAHPSRAQAGSWTLQTLDAPKELTELTERSLRLDDAGHPHVAYGGDHLYYAWHDGTVWHSEVVDDNPQTGSDPSLALDAGGRPRIAYLDAAAQALKYAYHDGNGWQVSVLAAGLGWGRIGTSLALDQNGQGHISFYDFTQDANYGRLKYAHQQPWGWTIDTVDVKLGAGGRTSIAVDQAGFAHVSYFNYSLNQLRYAARSEQGWQVLVLAGSSGSQVGAHSSLVLDSQDRPRISFSDVLNQALRYVYWDASWHFETIDNQGTVGLDCSLALDAQGQPHVSYSAGLGYALRYASRDDNGWHAVTVDGERERSTGTSLALTPDDSAHIGYLDFRDETNHVLKYAYQADGGWQMGQIDSQDPVSGHVSLALDVHGHAHISYRSGSGLKYAYQDASGRHDVVLDQQQYAGLYTSLAVDADGYPHISYCGPWPEHSLRYAYQDAAGWHTEMVQANLGMYLSGYTSLALDAAGYPHISYFSFVDEAVKYAFKDTLGWHFELVDGNGFVGKMHTSLALDSGGNPHIAFFDINNYSVEYAYRDADGWRVEVVGYAGDFGTDGDMVSMALDAEDRPHISYLHAQGIYDLMYAYRDAGGWHTETVDGEGDTGTYSSLAVDDAGKIHIAYLRAYDVYDLKYAYRDDGGWHLQTIDSAGEVGRFPSLVLNEKGRPRIGYLDSTNQALKYASFDVMDYRVHLPVVLRQAGGR